MLIEKPPPYGDGFSFWGLKKRGRKEDSHTDKLGICPGNAAAHGFRRIS